MCSCCVARGGATVSRESSVATERERESGREKERIVASRGAARPQSRETGVFVFLHERAASPLSGREVETERERENSGVARGVASVLRERKWRQARRRRDGLEREKKMAARARYFAASRAPRPSAPPQLSLPASAPPPAAQPAGEYRPPHHLAEYDHHNRHLADYGPGAPRYGALMSSPPNT